MEEVILANLVVAFVVFFVLYIPNRKMCSGFWDYTKIMLSVMLFYYVFYFGAVIGLFILYIKCLKND